MNNSQITALSSSQSKLIRNQKTDDGLGQSRTPTPFGSGVMTKNAGFISQNFDDNQMDMQMNSVRKSVDGLNTSAQNKQVLADCQVESIEVDEEHR